MELIASFFRQDSRDNSVSVVLQEAFHVKRKLPVVFEVICLPGVGEDATKIMEELVQWFYGKGLPDVSRKGSSALPGLFKKLKKNCKGYKGSNLAGVMAIGAHCILFCCGSGRIFLQNRRGFGAHEIPLLRADEGDEAEVQIQRGMLEIGAAIRLTLAEIPYPTELNLERKR